MKCWLSLLSTAAIWVTCGTILRADDSPEIARFLQVPQATFSSLTPTGLQGESFEANALPPDLRKILQTFDWSGDELGAPPTRYVGLKLDLNHDGVAEYFIINPAWSGTGGPSYLGFSQTPKGWTTICNFQGCFSLVPSAGKWPTIVAFSRGGFDSYSKTTMKFSGEKYRFISVESYERGVITKLPDAELTRLNANRL